MKLTTCTDMKFIFYRNVMDLYSREILNFYFPYLSYLIFFPISEAFLLSKSCAQESFPPVWLNRAISKGSFFTSPSLLFENLFDIFFHEKKNLKFLLTLKDIYSLLPKSTGTSSPVRTNGAQNRTSPNLSDSLIDFMAWFRA